MTAKKTANTQSGPPVEQSPQGSVAAFGHRFKDTSLLERALTHRSLAYETNPQNLANPDADNERLEFVGDAVLGLVVAEALFKRFPNSDEGALTQLRASVVGRKHLSAMAAALGLGEMLRLGKGEERTGGRSKGALLANALEAVIAAIYLDGGLKAAQKFVDRAVLAPALPELDAALAEQAHVAVTARDSGTFSGAVGDHKSALQEHLQAIGAGQPEYLLVAESGPDHRKRFRVAVRVTGLDGIPTVLAESEGSTKKAAQQEAARIAFGNLLRRGTPQPLQAAAMTPQAGRP